MERRHFLQMGIGAGLAFLSVAAHADTYNLRKNDVVPIVFETQLSTASNRAGDPFVAKVKDGRVFPEGTEFDGHVVSVQKKDGDTKPSMDLAIDKIVFVNGVDQTIDAVPIPLSKNYVDKGKDGRFTAKPTVSSGTAVGAGAVGGLLVGALLHKPFEGAFLGTLAGIIYSATNHDGDDVTIKEGSSAGALILDDVVADDSARSGGQVVDRPSAAIPTIRIEDKVIHFDDQSAPFFQGDTLMISLRPTADQLGYKVTHNGDYIFVEDDNHSLRIENGSAEYRLDGKKGVLNAPVALKMGNLYVPAQLIADIRGDRLQLSGAGTNSQSSS